MEIINKKNEIESCKKCGFRDFQIRDDKTYCVRCGERFLLEHETAVERPLTNEFMR